MALQAFLQDDPACAALAEGAVHAVAPVLDDPDPRPWSKLLDDWAWTLAARMPLPWNLHKALDELNDFLFREVGLAGDRETFGDPANAVLPWVILRKKGLPISLSIIWISLARRLGFDAVGVALPGHFLAALRTPLGLLHVDPFNGGRAVGPELASRLVHAASGGRTAFVSRMLEPVPDRAILTRLVRNLYAGYFRQEQWNEAMWAATHLVMLDPDDPRTYQERALVHLKRLSIPLALEDLRTALHILGENAPELETQIARLEQGDPPGCR